MPIAGFAEIVANRLVMRALVGSPDGSHLIEARTEGELSQAAILGVALADQLLSQGARAILDALYAQAKS